MPECTHLDHVKLTKLPESVAGCDDCLAAGTQWLHLRICLECGHVGCCDNSPERHGTAHARSSGHPLVLSSSANEDDVEHYVGLLDAGDLIEACTSSADVERTKPEPDLVSAAIEKAGTGRAVMMATRSGT